ncbi:unnamed protein product [Brachionus calyciflorus]|uniref:Uncharacterized protein n=1 Tax=Brachionus calyciflorus TaxID=104777 RepID=A0A813RQ07_9BILA|nr:unnamed protein product [Brachionus calyciflorus]
MPGASGHGKWPVEYGVGVKEDRISPKCAICTQKNCFSCEHTLTVRNAIFNHQPYLNPTEDFSIADRNSRKRRLELEEQQKKDKKNLEKPDRKIRNSQQDKKSQNNKSSSTSLAKNNQINPTEGDEKKAKKSKCTIL